MRGHRAGRPPRRDGAGSIPADAGAPALQAGQCGPREVYPRGCGGTMRRSSSTRQRRGLSPRMRGHRNGNRVALDSAGSIPADAGAPKTTSGSGLAPTVYPRGCGGTTEQADAPVLRQGLSPRMRGHPCTECPAANPQRSIPADAGAPTTRSRRTLEIGVYPRGCGGTPVSSQGPAPDTGLSPRMRGHPGPRAPSARRARSIPADAGAPDPARGPRGAMEVYPRGCGGTDGEARCSYGRLGLSPRMRGHPCSSLSGTGRYGPFVPCIAPKERHSVAGTITASQRVGSSGQMQQRRRFHQGYRICEG